MLPERSPFAKTIFDYKDVDENLFAMLVKLYPDLTLSSLRENGDKIDRLISEDENEVLVKLFENVDDITAKQDLAINSSAKLIENSFHHEGNFWSIIENRRIFSTQEISFWSVLVSFIARKVLADPKYSMENLYNDAYAIYMNMYGMTMPTWALKILKFVVPFALQLHFTQL